jgi:hypothetical protein
MPFNNESIIYVVLQFIICHAVHLCGISWRTVERLYNNLIVILRSVERKYRFSINVKSDIASKNKIDIWLY